MLQITLGLVLLTAYIRHHTLRFRRVIRHFCRFSNLDAEPELTPLYIAWLGYVQIFLGLASGFMLYKHVNVWALAGWIFWMVLLSQVLAAVLKRPEDQHIRDELDVIVNNYLTTDLKIATMKTMWKKYLDDVP